MPKKNQKHGGARRGAGRKPAEGGRTQYKTVALTEDMIAGVQKIADAQGLTWGAAARSIIKDATIAA